jgi:hypothetical protein
MTPLKQMMQAPIQSAQDAHAVPLLMPHGSADASSDFESAFEMLQGDDRARALWHRERAKIPFGRAS